MIALRIFTYGVVAFMLAPIVVTGLIAFTSDNSVRFPPSGFSGQWVFSILSDPYFTSSVLRSFLLALSASIISIVISLPCSFFIERKLSRARLGAETAVMSPRMVPEIVLALALLIFLERIRMAETYVGLLISHLVLCVPFAYRTISVGVNVLDRRLEWSSDILGAGATRRFIKVTVPQIKTALISAFAFTFILSFNNVTMALLLSPIGERTLPVEMFVRMQVGGMSPVVPAISIVLALLACSMFIVLDRTVGVFDLLVGRQR